MKTSNVCHINGKEKDFETGYHYYGARYYDSEKINWLSVDPLSYKYPSMSPYAYCANNPVILVDPDGRDIVVTTQKGKTLFILDDGKTEVTKMTSHELYKKKIQWFEPLADNYMPIKSISTGIENFPELKHFTWDEIDKFTETDRSYLSYLQNASGDWKNMKKGADGYLMVTVNGKPYWSDAIGQIPFAVDIFTDLLEMTGNSDMAIKMTILLGKVFGDGKLVGGKIDNSNHYDNYFILRGAMYASEKYRVGKKGFFGKYKLQKNNYHPNNLSKSINKNSAHKYGVNKGGNNDKK